MRRWPLRLTRLVAKSLLCNLLPDELFDPDVDESTVRDLFRKFVRLVEVENHSYCNRVCWFCPNAWIDRRSETLLMTDALLDKILRDLASIDYGSMLVWSRYHEPLAHESIYDRLARARRAVPRAQLGIVSNGDYVTKESVKRLEAAGVDQLLLDLYLPDGKERDVGELQKALQNFRARAGLEVVEQGSPWEYVCKGTSINCTMGVPNYGPGSISTRGGLVDVPELRNYHRRSVCFDPLHSIVIDFNGKGMLCCQTRSDAPEHAGAIIGDLSVDEYSLFDFYRDKAISRRGLIGPGPKTGPCETCSVSDEGPDMLARRPAVASLVRAIPGTRRTIDATVSFAIKHSGWQS